MCILCLHTLLPNIGFSCKKVDLREYFTDGEVSDTDIKVECESV